MEQFLEKIWERKAWIIASAFLLYCLNGIVTNVASIRDIAKQQLEFFNMLESLDPEYQRQDKVLDLYSNSVSSLKPLLEFYWSQVEPNPQVDSATQETGKRLAQLVLSKLRVHHAESSGMRLGCEACRELHKELLHGMQLNIDLASGFATFFDDANGSAAREKLANLYNEKLYQNQSIAASVIPAFGHENSKTRIALEKGIIDLRHLDSVLYFTLFYALYVLAFAGVAVWQYLRFQATTKKAANAALLP